MKRSILTASVLFSTLTLFFSGCAGHPEPANPVAIDKTLPQVSINGYLSDTDAIAFEWKPVSDPRVTGIRIYRDNPGGEDKNVYRIASIDNTLQTHYIDKGLTPATAYRYRFTTMDAAGSESMPESTVTAKTLSLPDPVSYFTATKELARSAKLIWRPHPDLRITGYEIERLDPDDETFRRIDSVEGRLNAEYIDGDLDDNKIYRYRLYAVTFEGKRTVPSQVITVSTKPLPQSPKGLQASRGDIRTVTLQWDATGDRPIEYYNIYRADDADGYYSYYAKVARTGFVDKTGENGAHFFYKVAAVDKDGLESPPSAPVEGSTKPAPAAPEMIGLGAKENAVVIRWKRSDERTRSYELLKTTRSGWFDAKDAVIRDIKTTSYTDVNVVAGQEYEYAVVAVDENGLRSEPSASKTILLEAP